MQTIIKSTDLRALCLAITMLGALTLLAGCASKQPAKSSATGSSGAYYKDDGPAASMPSARDLDLVPDAQPRDEPLHRFANRPYNVFGVEYKPSTSLTTLRQRGVASWYGRKYHGQKTAIGEVYDMFAMTAAHPTAPLPSFARVTHTRTGRSVVVRINDRGPFIAGRIVDLSYVAAHRLGIAQGGSAEVDFELLLPPFAKLAVAPPPQAVAAVPPLAPPPAQIAAAKEFFVQLGAFGNFANAQAFQQRMGAELNTLNLMPRVQQIDSLYRVRLGPFATRELAAQARDQAQSMLSITLSISSSPDR
jgi:rare lipoprotein A